MQIVGTPDLQWTVVVSDLGSDTEMSHLEPPKNAKEKVHSSCSFLFQYTAKGSSATFAQP